MNKLNEVTPGLYAINPKLSGSENHKGYLLYDENLGYIADVSPRDPDGKEGRANAKLLALSYDHALLLAAVTSGECVISIYTARLSPPRHFIHTNTRGMRVDSLNQENATEVFVNPFGCPILTPKLRTTLRAVCGLEENK